MKNFLNKLLVFSAMFVLMVVAVGCGGSTTVQEQNYSLPNEARGTLKVFGNTGDIVFNAKLVKVGESLAMSLDSEGDSFMVTISKAGIVLKRGGVSVDVNSLENSPLMSIYRLFMEFDNMKKIHTTDEKYTKVTASYKNTNYTLMFADKKLSSVVAPEFEFIVS